MGGFERSRQWAAAHIYCCLAVLLASLAPALSVETEHQFGFVSVKTNVNTTVVATCEQLADALSSEVQDNLIVVIAYIRCDPAVWDKAVVVAGNKTVTGPGHGVIVGAVDWGNGNDMVVVGNGSSVTFQDIILMQDFLGANAMLNLPFLSAGMDARATFKGVAVGVRVCPQPVGIFDERLRELERPGHIPGKQDAARLGLTGLFVTDVAFSPYDDSTWRQCNVIWRCGTRSALDPEFLSDFQDELVRPICGAPISITDMQSPVGLSLNKTTPQLDQTESSGSETDKAAIGISLAVLVIFFIIVIGGVLFVFRHRANQRRRKADELQRRIQGIQGVSGYERGRQDGQRDVGAPAQFRPLTLGSRTSSGNFPNVFNMDLADVELGKRLGRGKFGSVYKCSYKGVAVAVKVVDHRGEGLQPETGEPLEADLCKQMHHVNVLTTYLYKTVRFDNLFASTHNTWNMQTTNMSGSFMDSHGNTFSHLESVQNLMDKKGYRTFIVMEYCNGGSLLRGINAGAFFTQETGPFVMRALLTALDVARGMSFLHDMCIVHGDLRPESCLVRSEPSDKKGFVCKVGDFGLSRYVADASSLKASSVGSTVYAAPELLKNGTLTKAADVYSMGMILWRLLSDFPAYKSMTEEEIVEFVLRGQRPEIPSHFSKGYRQLVEDCWNPERTRRPPFHEIVERLQALIADAAARAGDTSARQHDSGSPRAQTSQKTWELLTGTGQGSMYSPGRPSGEGSTSYRRQEEGPSQSAAHFSGNDPSQEDQALAEEPPGKDQKSGLESMETGFTTEDGQIAITMTDTIPSEKQFDSAAEAGGKQKSRFQAASSDGGRDSVDFGSERNSDSDRGSSHGRSFLTRFLASRSSQGTPKHQDQPSSAKGRGLSSLFSKKVADSTSPPAAKRHGRFEVSVAKPKTLEPGDRHNKTTGSSSSSGALAEPAREPRTEDSHLSGTSTTQLPTPFQAAGNGELAAPGLHLESEQAFLASTQDLDEVPRPRAPQRATQES
eukprot:evm.model.scf_880.2 EVM.evm.TU.scf_880.2   scf_880:5499-9600(+)